MQNSTIFFFSVNVKERLQYFVFFFFSNRFFLVPCLLVGELHFLFKYLFVLLEGSATNRSK